MLWFVTSVRYSKALSFSVRVIHTVWSGMLGLLYVGVITTVRFNGLSAIVNIYL